MRLLFEGSRVVLGSCWAEWGGRYTATWELAIQTPMAQGRSTTIISMIQWTRTGRLSTKISLSLLGRNFAFGEDIEGLGGHPFVVPPPDRQQRPCVYPSTLAESLGRISACRARTGRSFRVQGFGFGFRDWDPGKRSCLTSGPI